MATVLAQHITFNLARAQQAALEVLVAFGLVLGAATFGHCNDGCSPYIKDPTPPTVNEVQYSGELAACVDKANSKKESQECRKEVSRRWGLCTKTDGIERCP